MEETNQSGVDSVSVLDQIGDYVESKYSDQPQDDDEDLATDQEATESETEPESGDQTGETEEEEGADPVFEIDGEEVSSEQLKEWKKSHQAAKDMQADYTRKTQEAAEIRRNAEQVLQYANNMAQAQSDMEGELAQIRELDVLYQMYSGRIQELIDADPQEALRYQQACLQIKDTRSNLVEQMNQKKMYIQQIRSDQHAKTIAEGVRELKAHIPDWSPSVQEKLNTFGQQAFGFSSQELLGVTDPRMVRVLHKAYLYDQMQSKKPALKQKLETVPKVVKTSAPTAQKTNRQQDLVKRAKSSGSFTDALAAYRAATE